MRDPVSADDPTAAVYFNSEGDPKVALFRNGTRILESSELLESPVACACCGHRLAVHPRLRLDAVTLEGPWEPGVCAGDDGEGCSERCLCFEVPREVPKP